MVWQYAKKTIETWRCPWHNNVRKTFMSINHTQLGHRRVSTAKSKLFDNENRWSVTRKMVRSINLGNGCRPNQKFINLTEFGQDCTEFDWTKNQMSIKRYNALPGVCWCEKAQATHRKPWCCNEFLNKWLPLKRGQFGWGNRMKFSFNEK